MSVLANNNQANVQKSAITISVSVDATEAMVLHMHPRNVDVVLHGVVSLALITVQRTADGAGVEVLSPDDVAVVRILSEEEITDYDLAQFTAHHLKMGSTPAAMSMAYILHHAFSQPEVPAEKLEGLLEYYEEFLDVSSSNDRQSLATQIVSRTRLWLSPDMHENDAQTAAKVESFKQFFGRAADMLEQKLPVLLQREAQDHTHADAEDAAVEQFETQQAMAHQLDTSRDEEMVNAPLADNPYLENILANSCNDEPQMEWGSQHNVLDLRPVEPVNPAPQQILQADDLQRQLMNLTALTPLLFVPRF